MAFLLDIITFLQISFSTNIFRINYKNQSNILHLIEARKNKTSTFAFMLTQ
ncbi:50S rRNA methyltransferase [Francisella tularensis]|nr:50S rRNA methyltransferase [Francisella tularensis]NDS36215.1 50S rRNA methyltransferase [Francisella tularensis subsp. holarctica]KXO25152.1 50S rRNA methyltransferase [Francisella tularensis]KXO33172.1 50S rRNA methyltransferase [Francisella tularensis]KXO36003.1 50S rRNA methyltransferase [Francisella tularensis]